MQRGKSEAFADCTCTKSNASNHIFSSLFSLEKPRLVAGEGNPIFCDSFGGPEA